MNADVIFVVADGQVVEQGNHEELIARNGKYAELWSKQIFLKPKDTKGADSKENELGDEGTNKKDGKNDAGTATKVPPPKPSAPKPASPRSTLPNTAPPRQSPPRSLPLNPTSPKPVPKPKPRHLQTEGEASGGASTQTHGNGKSNRQVVGTPKNGHKREVDQSKDL